MTVNDRLHTRLTGEIPTSEAMFDEEQADGTVTLGLVPSPGLPERLANDIRDQLASELAESVDNAVKWQVQVVSDPVTGSDVDTRKLLEEIERFANVGNWDYAIALTDVPVRRHEQIVIADASVEQQAGWISIPALGAVAVKRRVRRFIVQLAGDLHQIENKTGEERLLDSEHAARAEPGEADEVVDTRYVAKGMLASLRLLSGMVFANKPWSIVPAFRATAVTTIATGSYGLIFSSIWELGEFSSPLRLAVLSLLAILLLSTWLIISHGLWHPHRGATSQYLTTLYNFTTIVTIWVGVFLAYVIVYLVLLFEATVFMPSSLLETRLDVPVNAFNYMTAAWVASSVGTLAGALGAGLEDTERVRRATFSWRMRRRFEEFEEARKEEEEDEEHNTTESTTS